VISRSQYFD